MKIFVGNLSYQVTEEDLRKEFAAYGARGPVNIVTDRYDNRPKGFAFVEMPNKSEAEAAIAGLNGKMMGERAMVVNESRPKSDNKGRFNSNQRGSFGRGQGSGGSRRGGFGNQRRTNRY
jgi:RNA recognition motif-containing protein